MVILKEVIEWCEQCQDNTDEKHVMAIIASAGVGEHKEGGTEGEERRHQGEGEGGGGGGKDETRLIVSTVPFLPRFGAMRTRRGK